ncbi:MAG: SPFH domain-containing protein [Tannerellaceae bacterium]|jgi:regulator of protease activity HflC (stomatin/prohibitin superfamily)|nr:SPFH domain-containing protein [Tannerellaceae bacterium]
METQEKKFTGIKFSAFSAIAIALVLALIILGICIYEKGPVFFTFGSLIVFLTFIVLVKGLIIIEPNNVRVMVLFGRYKGTLTENGFFWVNPFLSKRKTTLRARNLDIKPIKVNDKMGNPIMIGAVLVWRIKNTYKVMFDIASGPTDFVQIQSDAALRQVAGMYAYDNNDKDAITLRSDSDEVSQRLEDELNSRIAIAGIEVIEARINYLAYASEIAGVMLRRQQADAIIAAREKIVEGAVSMVQLALDRLAKEEIVHLDEDKKAAMVSNLLVVLCADEAAQPVLNTGTLHH